MHRWVLFLALISSVMSLIRVPIGLRQLSTKITKGTPAAKRLNSVVPGHVYFVATPIGNLQDITARARETLTEADYVCAEDTRHTIGLFRHLQIPYKQMISHHEHNHHTSIPHIVELARSGKSIAVVSDAGTPGISDPGTELAAALAKVNVPIHPVPGPSAVISGLSISGFPCSPFTFFGFLPAKGTPRKEMLRQIYDTKHTVVLYEAPHRIQRTLQDLASFAPLDTAEVVPQSMISRSCVSCRELTKVHEQISRGTVAQVLQGLVAAGEGDSSGGGSKSGSVDAVEDDEESHEQDTDDTPTESNTSSIRSKGEFTLILGPVSPQDTTADSVLSTEERLNTMLLQFRADGVRRSEAVGLCVDMLKLSKRVVYAKALTIPDW